MRLRGLGNQASSSQGQEYQRWHCRHFHQVFQHPGKRGEKQTMIFNYQYRIWESQILAFLDLCQVEKEQSRTLTNIIVLGKVLFEEHMF